MTGVRAGGRNPFELFMLGASVLSGLLYFLSSAPPPNSLARLLPDPILLLWYGLLLAGGVAGIVGVLWRDPVTGLFLERAGMLFLGPGALVYAVALFSVGGLRALGAGIITTAFGLACIARIVQIVRGLRRVRIEEP